MRAYLEIGGRLLNVHSFSLSETLSRGAGILRSVRLHPQYFGLLKEEEPIRILIEEKNGRRPIWEGLLFNPQFQLSEGGTFASCTGKSHTTKLLNRYVSGEYYFCEIGHVAQEIIKEEGFKSKIQIERLYENDFSASVDDFDEQTDSVWNLEDGEYSGEDTVDLDKTIFKHGYGYANYAVKCWVKLISGSDCGLYFRYQDSTHYYRIKLGATAEIYLNNGTGEMLLGKIPIDGWNDAGTLVRLHAVNGEFALCYNSNVIFFVDTTLKSGTFGFYVNASHAHFDNLEIFDDRDMCYHYKFDNERLFDVLEALRLLRYIKHPNGWDFHVNADNEFVFEKRDYDKPYVLELKEGVNILEANIYKDFENVRNEIILFGTRVAKMFPRSYKGQFVNGMAESWEYDATWYSWAQSGEYIEALEESLQETTWAYFPKLDVQKEWNLKNYDKLYITMHRRNAATNFLIHLGAFNKDGESSTATIDASGVGFPDDTTHSIDIGIDVDYIGIKLELFDTAAEGFSVAGIVFKEIYLERSVTDRKIVIKDVDTPYSRRVMLETNTHLESFERGKQYAESLLELYKSPRWKGSVTVRGNSLLRAGENVRVICPSIDFDRIMRITSAEHTYDGQFISRLHLDAIEKLFVDEIKEIERALSETRNRDIPITYIMEEL